MFVALLLLATLLDAAQLYELERNQNTSSTVYAILNLQTKMIQHLYVIFVCGVFVASFHLNVFHHGRCLYIHRILHSGVDNFALHFKILSSSSKSSAK